MKSMLMFLKGFMNLRKFKKEERLEKYKTTF